MFTAVLLILVAFVIALFIIRNTIFLVKYLKAGMSGTGPTVWPRPVRCARCDEQLGTFVRSRGFRAMVLGIWTCTSCRSEFDQLDNVRIARSWNAHLIDSPKRARREAIQRSFARRADAGGAVAR